MLKNMSFCCVEACLEPCFLLINNFVFAAICIASRLSRPASKPPSQLASKPASELAPSFYAFYLLVAAFQGFEDMF
jgi:hypothetical protein